MKAVVTKEFNGAPDGEVYPRRLRVGDVIEGALAEAAVAQEWAIEGETLPEGAKAAPPVEIPLSYADLNAADSLSLARQLGATEGVRSRAAAQAVISAEVSRREQAQRTAPDEAPAKATETDPAKA